MITRPLADYPCGLLKIQMIGIHHLSSLLSLPRLQWVRIFLAREYEIEIQPPRLWFSKGHYVGSSGQKSAQQTHASYQLHSRKFGLQTMKMNLSDLARIRPGCIDS